MTELRVPIEDLADQLAACGVAALFGVPGSGASLKLITTLERRGVPFYGTCHEAAAATMAGAFGRIGRSQGCCVSIKGPGLANMVPGILSNFYENLPVISLAEAYPAGPRSRAHKALDHATVLASCAKAYSGLEGADTISRLTAIARDEIPGPVHIDLAPQSGVVRVSSRWTRRPAAPAGALEAIGKARRPIVIAGGLATRRQWGNTLTSLRIPVFTTVAAKGIIDEHGSFAAGIFTGDGKDATPEARLIPEADLVVGLGLRNLEVLTPQTFGVPCVLVDAVGDGWGFAGASSFAAATDDDFAAVVELLFQREWGADLVVQAKNHVIDLLTADEWMPGRAMTTVRAALPAQTRVVVDTGAFCTVAEHVWEVADASRFIASANGRFMGTSVPMAIGTALADRSCPVVCLAGDGGLRVSIGEMKLALALKLPLLFVLVSDGRYGSIAAAPSARGLSRTATTIASPSWVSSIAALGFPAVQVSSAAALETAVRGWVWQDGPMFLEAVFDPEAYELMTTCVR